MIIPSAIDLSVLPSVPLEQYDQLPSAPCVYFAIDCCGVVQYIGKSVNPQTLWKIHHRWNQLVEMEGVRIACLLIPVPELLPAIESALIKLFQPLLNDTPILGKKRRKIGDPDGRGRNPRSQAALPRTGRPRLPASAKRQRLQLPIRNDCWNGLLDLAANQNLATSRLIEQFALAADFLTLPIAELNSPTLVARLNLAPTQLLDLPVIEVVFRAQRFKRSTRTRRSQPARMPQNRDRKIHSLTFAPTTVEPLEQLAQSQQLEVAGLLELFGEQAELLQMPLGQLIDPVRLVDRITYALPVLLKMSVLELLRSEVL